MSRPRTRAPRRRGRRGRARGDVEGAIRKVFTRHLAAREGARLWKHWRKTLRLLRPLGAISQGNRVRVLSDGDQAFEAMWGAIAAAQRTVLQSIYILEPDAVGRRTIELLTEAARRGCQVTLVYDAFGSLHVGEDFFAPLKAAGATVVAYNPLWRGVARRSRLERNHLKIVAVDGEVAFCGGLNVADEYAGKKYGNALFRDTLLQVEGPCVFDLARLVATVVFEVTGRATKIGGPIDPRADGALVQILESRVRRERRAIQKALRTTITRAVDHCWLTSPYFVPPQRAMRTLVRAARRGVDVRVLTAGRSDVPIVTRASRHLYGRLLANGVRIYEMHGSTLHAKTAVIDGVYSMVGSFNLDRWSDRRNLEVKVAVLDRALARELEQGFQQDLELSEEVTLARWRKRRIFERAGDWIAYQIMRI